FVFVLEGELVLATDLGEQTLTPGMAAGFPAGSGDGHHLLNRTDEDAVYLEVGDRTAGDEVDYPDIDMLIRLIDGKRTYIHRDGKPYK
ncbi:MAG TPA: cupin domain-containing protein, partial [Rhodospirillales bacterium]